MNRKKEMSKIWICKSREWRTYYIDWLIEFYANELYKAEDKDRENWGRARKQADMFWALSSEL